MTPGCASIADRSSRSSSASSSSWPQAGAARSRAIDDPPLGVHHPDQHLRSPEVDADRLHISQPPDEGAEAAVGLGVRTMRQYYPQMQDRRAARRTRPGER